MKLKDYTKEDLETMSYSEITSIILNEKGSKMKIVEVFQKICNALEMAESEFENKIADYFELITTDKNFIVLEKGYCDLKTRHNKTVVVEDDDETSEPDEIDTENSEEETAEDEENQEEDIYYDDEDDVDDDIDEDDLDDFVVVDDEEETSI